MAYNAYITKIKNLRKHTNADRLQVGEVFGNYVIVGLDTLSDELGVYFPTDGRLGVEYCEANHLLKGDGGYLEPNKRHVSSLKLRGEKSDGLFMKLESLSKFCNVSTLKEGDTIDILNKVLICEKYVPLTKTSVPPTSSKKYKKQTVEKESFPLFQQHTDTSQLAYNTHQFKEGDVCYITLKQHGTSQRTSYTIKEKKKNNIPAWLLPLFFKMGFKNQVKKSWEVVTGTRRVVLKTYDGGFYGSNSFREKWHKFFEGKLKKGETVYYEIVGYTNGNGTIMPDCANAKTKDKDFIRQYGETTRFTYGCEEGQNDIAVYRMTMTNEDGDVVEYPTELVQLRSEQMGAKFVPIFDKFIFTTVEDLMERANQFVDGADPIGKTHIREGIVVRVDNKEKFTAYKHKNFMFKVLEGIIKTDDVLDMEEADAIKKEE